METHLVFSRAKTPEMLISPAFPPRRSKVRVTLGGDTRI